MRATTVSNGSGFLKYSNTSKISTPPKVDRDSVSLGNPYLGTLEPKGTNSEGSACKRTLQVSGINLFQTAFRPSEKSRPPHLVLGTWHHLPCTTSESLEMDSSSQRPSLKMDSVSLVRVLGAQNALLASRSEARAPPESANWWFRIGGEGWFRVDSSFALKNQLNQGVAKGG